MLEKVKSCLKQALLQCSYSEPLGHLEPKNCIKTPIFFEGTVILFFSHNRATCTYILQVSATQTVQLLHESAYTKFVLPARTANYLMLHKHYLSWTVNCIHVVITQSTYTEKVVVKGIDLSKDTGCLVYNHPVYNKLIIAKVYLT